MEDKYYVPELSEIYFGFEFEINNSKDFYFFEGEFGWHKTMIDYGVLGNIENLHKLILDKQIRVKYLDKEGIEQALEECGFIFTCYPSKISDPGIPFWWLIKIDPQGKLEHNHTFQLSIIDGFLKIEEDTFGHRKGYYYGKCKNESKLQQILKDLNL